MALATGPSYAEVFTGENLNQPFVIHGRLDECVVGSALERIWIVGSKRKLDVNADSPALDRLRRRFLAGHGSFSRTIFADFMVEPLAPDIKGHMRPVRVLDIKHIVVTEDDKVVVTTDKL
jgi:hypothetical protein